MMGAHHAATGAAAWVALSNTLTALPSWGVVSMTPAEVGLGAAICAGAALLPDADHSSATISRSAGLLSRVATRVVSAGTGGHRNGTHSGVSVVVVLLLAWLFARQGWIDATPWSAYVIGAGIAGMIMVAFALKVLKIVASWLVAWVVGFAVAAVITNYFPELWAWLPLAIAVGWIAHLAGDFLTVGGLPIFWPFEPKPPKWLGSTPFWTRGGYFALPVLGRAGSWREWALCIPISVYAIVGVGLNLVAALLRDEHLRAWPFIG